jgi:hypothetical protein
VPSVSASACDQGKAVAWHTLEPLAALLRGHRADEIVAQAIGKLIRADLVIIDDVGMVQGFHRGGGGAVSRRRRRL